MANTYEGENKKLNIVRKKENKKKKKSEKKVRNERKIGRNG